MGLFEDAQASAAKEQSAAAQTASGRDEAIVQLRVEQEALLREFCRGMQQLGIPPSNHEVVYVANSPNNRLGHKSWFPKRQIYGFDTVGNYFIGSQAAVYAKRHNKNWDRRPMPLPVLDPKNSDYPGQVTDSYLRWVLVETLKAHMPCRD